MLGDCGQIVKLLNLQKEKHIIQSNFQIYLIKLLGPRSLGPKEIDWLFVPPGKAYSLQTDQVNRLCPPRKSGSSQTIHTYKPFVA